ncbi:MULTISPECIES: hypothetical protein [unclassified Modicisalibacter]|uniref:hypothetical protein n=1 Tax=unclassified Modicisalibacter TaxID=2679913 RepID=UPI001EF06E05|nr:MULTISPECIES: hypothetical protein [unclassified Modicisalibacter]
MLMMQQVGQHAMRLTQAVGHTISPQRDANGQGVDEHTQRPLDTLGSLHASEQQGANDKHYRL